MLAVGYPDSDAVKRHIPRIADYLWVSEDHEDADTTGVGVGLRVQRASHRRTGLATSTARLGARTTTSKSHARRLSGREECIVTYPGVRLGTRDHGWPISDCSSEGLKAAPRWRRWTARRREAISVERLSDTSTSFSPTRTEHGRVGDVREHAFVRVGRLNPAEIGDIMIDYPYVECSSAVCRRCKFSGDTPTFEPRISPREKDGSRLLKRIQKQMEVGTDRGGVFHYARGSACRV